jgi:hypothetical protein
MSWHENKTLSSWHDMPIWFDSFDSILQVVRRHLVHVRCAAVTVQGGHICPDVWLWPVDHRHRWVQRPTERQLRRNQLFVPGARDALVSLSLPWITLAPSTAESSRLQSVS